MINSSARPYRITIYRDDADTVGVDVSDMVSEEGLAMQRSPVELEAPIVCTAEFTLIADSDSGGDLDPDTSLYIRPGARVYFEYRNYAGVWVEMPWGARQVLAFATADRPDGIDPGQPWKPWTVQVQCQQTLKQQQWIESAFDAEHGRNEALGSYRNYEALARGICQAKDLEFSPQPGDPVPTFEYNTYLSFDPRTADSALAYLNKLIYCSPDTSGYTYFLWQDNNERVRVGKANLTTTRIQADLLFSVRWEPYSADLLSFKPINQQRQQMPGKLRVSAIARFDEFKQNPLESTTRSPADGATNSTQIQEAYSYDHNNWVFAQRFIKTKTTVPKSQLKKDEVGSVGLERVEKLKEYDLLSDRRLFLETTRRWGPEILVDENSQFPWKETELTKEVRHYSYNYDGTLNSVRTQLDAIPKLVQGEEDPDPAQKLALKGAASSIDAIQSAGGSDFTKTKFRAFNLERQSDLIAYQPTSNANTPDSRPQDAETQETPWIPRQIPIFQDRVLLYNGVALSKRIKSIDVGAFVFGGARMSQLADNLVYREAGSYSQYTVGFALGDAIAAAWEKPGLGLVIYDYLTQKTKIFGSFGGENIVFGNTTVECLINAESIGTTEDGNMITAAEIQRVTLDGQPRVTLDGQARIV